MIPRKDEDTEPTAAEVRQARRPGFFRRAGGRALRAAARAVASQFREPDDRQME